MRHLACNNLNCNYDSSLFPGAIWRNHQKKNSMVVLIFESGRLVITGARERSEICDTYAQVLPCLMDARLEKDKGEKDYDSEDVTQILKNLFGVNNLHELK